MKNSQEDLLVVHCFCVCGGSALFGGLLRLSRFMECEVLSHSRFVLSLFFVYCICIPLVVFVFVVLSVNSSG